MKSVILKNKNCLTKVLGGLKIAAYFTGIIPLAFAIVYAVDVLSGRVGEKTKANLSSQELRMQDVQKKAFGLKKTFHPIVFPKFTDQEISDRILQRFPDTCELGEIVYLIQCEMNLEDFKKNPERYIGAWRTEREALGFDDVETPALWFLESELQRISRAKVIGEWGLGYREHKNSAIDL